MKAPAEVYKGIEFVRLSSLTREQVSSITGSPFARKTIKILRDGELLTDCLPYTSYLEWYYQSSPVKQEFQKVEFSQPPNGLNLALE